MKKTNKGFYGPDWVPVGEPTLATTTYKTLEDLKRYKNALLVIANQDLHEAWENPPINIAREALDG